MSEEQPNDLSDEALAFIVRLNSGAATKGDAADFAAWRQRSAAHEAAAREAEAIWGDASDLHEDAATRTVQPGREPTPRKPRKLLGLAATVLILGGAGLWASGALRPLTADATTGLGETRTLTLADGSRVTLNAGSAIDIGFTPNVRRVTLREGEAFFEVAKDSTRPFDVVVDGMIVTARGTAFDVSREDDETIVAVSDHAVRLVPPEGAGLDLAAGQEVEMDRAGRLGAVRAVDRMSVAAWREGLVVAENRPLGDIVAALRHYHRGWILIREPSLARLRVNAVLDLKTPKASLAALARGLPIIVTTISPYLIVVGRR